MGYSLLALLSMAALSEAIAPGARTGGPALLSRHRHQGCGQDPALISWRAALNGLAPRAQGATAAYQPLGNTTLLVESDVSAWNNVRMSWEAGVCLAFLTQRRYRVPHIPVDSYADARLKFMDHGHLRQLNLFDYYDEETFRRVIPCALDSDTLPDGKTFAPEKNPWALPIEKLSGPDYTHLVYREGPGHMSTRVFTQYAGVKNFVPHEDYIRLIESAFKLREDLLCRAIKRLVSYGLSPLSYVALHRRRGDTVKIDMYNVSSRAAAEYVAPVVRGKTVLVVTDTYEPKFLADLSTVGGAARVICWANKKLTGDDLVYAAQVDMLAAVGAKEFIGSPASTFSTGIIRWRVQAGTHKVGDPVYFTEKWTPGYEGWPSPGAKGTYL